MSNESFQRLEYAINAESDTERQIKLLEDSLMEMSYTATPVIRYIEKGLQVIEDSHGGAFINEIIKSSGIGERQFNRRFREVTGITPKCYSKIIQLHNVISLMQKKQYKSLHDISFKAYFYDMSHFAHRFKELTGFTPAGFIRSDKHIAMKYYSDPT